MNERRLQIMVGLLVIGCGVLLTILLVQFAGQEPVFRRTKQYLVHVPEAPGVSPNTPVRKSGILIGRVSRVQLAEEIPEFADWGGVILTVEIDAHRKIFHDEVFVIRRTLLGDAVLEVVRRQSPGRVITPVSNSSGEPQPGQQSMVPPRQEVLPGGPPLKGEIFVDPLEIVADLRQDLSEAAQAVRRASNEIAEFVNRVNEIMGREDGLPALRKRLEELADQTSSTMQSFRELAANVNDLIGGPELREQVRDAVGKIGPALEDLRSSLAQVRQTFGELQQATSSARANLENLRPLTESLGQRGPALTARLEESLNNFQRLSADLAEFANRINDRRSTLGKLAADTELYDNLNELVLQVDHLSRQLQPVVRDLRVFSDKIARNPEILGVRGAIQRSSGTKGVPSLAELDPIGWREGLHSQLPAYSPR